MELKDENGIAYAITNKSVKETITFNNSNLSESYIKICGFKKEYGFYKYESVKFRMVQVLKPLNDNNTEFNLTTYYF